jgi:hypothetical protein
MFLSNYGFSVQSDTEKFWELIVEVHIDLGESDACVMMMMCG